MNNQPVSESSRKGRGCFFYGCLTCIVLLVVFLFLIFAGVRWVRGEIAAWTDTSPAQLPKVEMSEPEFQSLQQRVTAFHNAMQQGTNSESLTLSEREINALLIKTPEGKAFADKVYVTIESNQIKGQVSIPLDNVPLVGKGRYLNGKAAFNVALLNGTLLVTAQEIEVKGKKAPETFMSGFRSENLAKELISKPEQAEVIRKLESIEVHDGTVTIKAKPQATP
jgi:hypothetical protein